MPRRNDKGRSTQPRLKVDLSWLRPCTCGARAIGYTCRPDCASVVGAKAAA